MNYIVYTDGSCKPSINKASGAYIIRTKDTCVKIGYFSFPGKHILEAEMVAVKEAIKYLTESGRLTEEDTVKFFIDSLDTLKMYMAILRDKEVENRSKWAYIKDVEKAVREIRDTGAKIYFNKIDAHQDKFNTNKACDSLAKLALQYSG